MKNEKKRGVAAELRMTHNKLGAQLSLPMPLLNM